MDEKERQEIREIVKEAIQPLQEDMQGMKQDMQGMKQDIHVLSARVDRDMHSLVEDIIHPVMDMMDRGFREVNARLDRLEQRVTRLEETVGRLEQRTTSLERQFVRLNDEIADIKTLLKQHQTGHPTREEIDALELRVSKLEAEVFPDSAN